MKRLIIVCLALLAMVLTACGAAATEPQSQEAEGPVITIYRPPT